MGGNSTKLSRSKINELLKKKMLTPEEYDILLSANPRSGTPLQLWSYGNSQLIGKPDKDGNILLELKAHDRKFKRVWISSYFTSTGQFRKKRFIREFLRDFTGTWQYQETPVDLLDLADKLPAIYRKIRVSEGLTPDWKIM